MTGKEKWSSSLTLFEFCSSMGSVLIFLYELIWFTLYHARGWLLTTDNTARYKQGFNTYWTWLKHYNTHVTPEIRSGTRACKHYNEQHLIFLWYVLDVMRNSHLFPLGEESVLPLLTQESNSKSRRGILRRAVFSEDQRKALEKMFQKQKYISKTDRKKLALNLGLKESQVRNVLWGKKPQSE